MKCKIQIITNNYAREYDSSWKISRLNDVDTFDSYDYNFIDLTTNEIWQNRNASCNESNYKDDIASIGNMIKHSKKASFIIVFPQNTIFSYDSTGGKYYYSKPLRDNINGIMRILSDMNSHIYKSSYEPNKSNLLGQIVNSDFYFSIVLDNSTNILKSEDSEKIVSFKYENIYYTTLNILNENAILNYLKIINTKDKVDYPDWFEEISFYNDEQLKNDINESNKIIAQETKKISLSKEKISENMKYKSILFETGDHLVEIVFEMLEKILSIDLSAFVDEKNEDFNFSIDDDAFVGEIKGVNEGVRNSHLSQLENNKQLFMEKSEKENAKGILIIAQQRKTAPSMREEVHFNQIKYANQHDLLIITTGNLLSIFQYHLQGLLDINKFKEILKNNKGLLKEEWK